VVGDGMGIRGVCGKKGDLRGERTVFMLMGAEEPPRRSQSAPRSVEAP
jgi:hypothetical protein